MYIIQVYFSIKNNKDEEIESIYDQLQDLVTLAKDNSNLFIMRDFNAAVSCQVTQYIYLGNLDYENMNSRVQKLVEFCEQYELIISSTVYKVLNRRKYTWKSSGDNIRRLQIDYILVKKRYHNQIKSSHSYSDFKIDIDHRRSHGGVG